MIALITLSRLNISNIFSCHPQQIVGLWLHKPGFYQREDRQAFFPHHLIKEMHCHEEMTPTIFYFSNAELQTKPAMFLGWPHEHIKYRIYVGKNKSSGRNTVCHQLFSGLCPGHYFATFNICQYSAKSFLLVGISQIPECLKK